MKRAIYSSVPRSSAGQTLIETMVAAFILVMGITAALGLANYSLSASGSISKQLVGMGLAREGLEAFKNMRDTNWLRSDMSEDCYNFILGGQGTPEAPGVCYRDWLSAPDGFTLKDDDNPRRGTALLDFNAKDDLFWNMRFLNSLVGGGRFNNGQLFYNPKPDGGSFYTHDSSAGQPSDYYRTVSVNIADTAEPFDKDIGPRVLVTSRVWWNDKKCPNNTSFVSGKCSIQLQMYVTNWRTY